MENLLESPQSMSVHVSAIDTSCVCGMASLDHEAVKHRRLSSSISEEQMFR